MAFFDEGDEPRTRAQPAPRRRPPGGGGGGDPDAIRNRRIVAGVLGLAIVLLLVVAVRGCVESAAENALKDYNEDVASIVAQSDRDVGRPFFDLLQRGEDSPVELESQINQLRVLAERQVDTAEDFDTPDEAREAQRELLMVLDMRAQGLGRIASLIRSVNARGEGDAADEAVEGIAGQMQQFLASDVIYDARVMPFVKEALAEREIGGQRLADSQFLPNLGWLAPDTVGERLDVSGGGGGGGGGGDRGEPAPGLHGHGIVSVAVGDQALEPGETANRIPAGADTAFTVTFANQGENDETDVNVRVRIRPSGGGRPITVQKRVPKTTAGANTEVAIPLGQAPPIGDPATIEVLVAGVPGEEKTDNNRQTYTAIFTR